jgi:hypothetical protein
VEKVTKKRGGVSKMNKMIVSGLFLMLCLIGAGHAEAAVIINEFLADPPLGILGDVNRDGVRDSSQDEFVELLNTGSESQDLSFWTLWDNAALRHQFPALTILSPWESLVVFGGGHADLFELAFTASTGTLSLNNSGDKIVLKNSLGSIVDQVIFGSNADRDQSLLRYPLGSDAFRLHSEVSDSALPFSPGREANGQPFKNPSAVPEPSTSILLGLGLLLWDRCRRGRSNNIVE